MSVTGFGLTDRFLKAQEIETIVSDYLAELELDGQRVLVIIPDSTRTMPLPLFFRLLAHNLLRRVKALDFMVALGTHPPLTESGLLKLVGITPEEKASVYAGVNLFNHSWVDPQSLVELGVIPSAEVAELSGGLLAQDVSVRLNRAVLAYDQLLVCGPVFPHEVVGFSGGNKYFFPGISGGDMINFTHWLSALITLNEIIGVKHTPVRRMIDRAAAFIPTPRHALCCVVAAQGTMGVFCGTPEEAWSAAADLSAILHIHWCDHSYRQVLSVLPEMYEEVWVGAKGVYKLDPVVADGGEVILYAPHITRLSQAHGEVLRQVGYHVRDYFVKQWPRARGLGTYDAETGVERARIQVTLATGLTAEECAAVNLGYRDPRSIQPQDWAGREDEGILFVPHAGETLYRLK
jgi:nickel-dependent lactate racemase